MADEKPTAVTINVNGRAIEAQPGELLIEAAERAGAYIPRFCYHPRMEPVGVCRMCLVEVEGPRGATLQPACYLRVNDGMNVTTDSDKVRKVQDGVLEFLLANHPLDCPVCDKGGECPLQDQAMAHGSGETRFIEEKRHFAKPIDIGELVLLDRERCIQCSRCTRFAAEVAGEAQIAFAGRGDLIEVASSPTQPFDSVFSGNTVQICPVGALTAKPYRFSARPWDLDQVESTCTTCAVGCRVAVQSSGNRLTRVLGVDVDGVNRGWLCDKGRFSLDHIDGHGDDVDLGCTSTRLTSPLVRRGDQLVATSWSEALARASELLQGGDPQAVGAIGGAALTNEGAFAWERLVRGVLGSDHLDAQFDDGLDAGLVQSLPSATINEAASATTVVTIGGDLREELPVLYLRLRENFTKRAHSLIELSPVPTSLSALARVRLAVRPGDLPAVVKALGDLEPKTPRNSGVASRDLMDARALLGTGAGVVVVVGRGNLAESAAYTDAAIHLFATQFPDARFLFALRRANVVGALDMGLSPTRLPGRRPSETTGRDTRVQLEAMAGGTQRATLLLGGGLLANAPDPALTTRALERSAVVLVSGHGGDELAFADVVLPALVGYERTGTVTNLEGRVTALAAKIAGPGAAWDDVAIAAELAELCGQHLGLTSITHAAETIEATLGYPASSVLLDGDHEGALVGRGLGTTRRPLDPMAIPGLRSVEHVGLGASTGALRSATLTSPSVTTTSREIPAAVTAPSSEHEEGFALVMRRSLYDDGVAMAGSPALRPLAAQSVALMNTTDIAELGGPSGVTVRQGRAKAVLPVIADDQVARGVVVVTWGSRDAKGRDVVRALRNNERPVTYVTVEGAL